MIAPVFSITSPIGARLYWHPELGHILVACAQMDRRSRHGRRHPRPDGRLRAYPGGEWIGRAWPLPGSNGTSDLTRLDPNLYSHRLGVAALFGLSSVGGFNSSRSPQPQNAHALVGRVEVRVTTQFRHGLQQFQDHAIENREVFPCDILFNYPFFLSQTK